MTVKNRKHLINNKIKLQIQNCHHYSKFYAIDSPKRRSQNKMLPGLTKQTW